MKKEYRIKKSSEIQKLIRKRKTVGNSYFILYYNKNHEIDNFRYALSVPKKYGNAVHRNLMKRRLREIIKVNNIEKTNDFFVVVKPKAKELGFIQIKDLVEKLFAKAKILGE
ncbi:MAG: ribonuclease P protein component [Tenericutes bacterium]|nr:ribonuclease P protein component [Mycoplasmatota bacterium]